MKAPAVALSDLDKPLDVLDKHYQTSHERQGIASEVLAQMLGAFKRRVAYFSKQLDMVARGWPSCLRTTAVPCLLMKEAKNLTMGQPLTVPGFLVTKGHLWLSRHRILQHQAMLIDTLQMQLKPCHTLNPATLLPDLGQSATHSCPEGTDRVYSSRRDLQTEPLSSAEVWFGEGNNFTENRQRKAGYAVVSLNTLTGAKSWPQAPQPKRLK